MRCSYCCCVVWVEQDGWTPLHSANWQGHLEVCQWLVAECGCDASAKTNVSCSRCIVNAIVRLSDSNNVSNSVCCGGYVGILWIEQNGRTLLHLASYKGHLEVCKWLVTECGSDAAVKKNVSCS